MSQENLEVVRRLSHLIQEGVRRHDVRTAIDEAPFGPCSIADIDGDDGRRPPPAISADGRYVAFCRSATRAISARPGSSKNRSAFAFA